MLYALLALIVLATWLFCLFDLLATDEKDIRLLPKFGWFLVILLGFQFGAIAWLLLGRPRRRRNDRPAGPPAGPPPDAPRGPDDDPDFLRNLERRIRGDD